MNQAKKGSVKGSNKTWQGIQCEEILAYAKAV
jgi:hypothetical protein